MCGSPLGQFHLSGHAPFGAWPIFTPFIHDLRGVSHVKKINDIKDIKCLRQVDRSRTERCVTG